MADTKQLPKTPEAFLGAELLAKDFDGTVAATFEASPGGIGVHEAHHITVEAMFGPSALDYYVRSGGLRNRAAVEIVRDLAPDAEDNELDALVKQFIDTKLDVLLGEIGTYFSDGSVWPRPTRGYLELRERVEQARSEGRFIDDLVLSAGHEPFINKTYDVWGIARPTHLVAEDTLRRLTLTYSSEEITKPSPILLEIARNTWRESYQVGDSDSVRDELERVLYVGDDPYKDGELAARAGVKFVLVDAAHPEIAWQAVASHLQLGNLAIHAGTRDG